ncbi:hypothetical protein H0H81_007612 [Sphagnurus paluster]|uniref:Acetyl-coenzyme A transporter 1 n=1 Tax=Sphagnurus paluster TaxID=117069 RepID=A0A9P7FSN2_9AGAR|nr:hypothetical protein H0H81_007612 [Sphagnurus paluster]
MSVRRKANKNKTSEQDLHNAAVDEDMKPTSVSGNSMAVSSSLNSIQINPRTPKTPRSLRGGTLDNAEEGVEMSLLGEEEREQAARDLEDDEVNHLKRPIGAKDRRNMVLLCILCESLKLSAKYLPYVPHEKTLFKESRSKWGVPHLTLAAYLKFWSIVCFSVTLWLLFFKKEDKEPATEADMSIKAVYKTIWTICKLRHVQILVLVHLVAKLGFAANEAVTGLKMIEKGFKREDLALVVLIDFPFQIMGGWLAAKWSRGDKPLRPWLYAFVPRLFLALVATLIVLWFPKPPISTAFFLFLILHTVVSSFASTVQFVGISAFHTRVSDPLIGGTYMTLLNTFTNMGGTWPKWFVLKGVDLLSDATCQVAEDISVEATECVSDHGKALCKDINGVCITHRDGYYSMSALCMVLGVVILVTFIIPKARKLQALPISVWRVKME